MILNFTKHVWGQTQLVIILVYDKPYTNLPNIGSNHHGGFLLVIPFAFRLCRLVKFNGEESSRFSSLNIFMICSIIIYKGLGINFDFN